MSIHARNSAPATSHEAVPKNISQQMRRVLRGYADGVARLDQDAYRRVNMDAQMNSGHPRCTDLRRVGFIKRTGARGTTISGKQGYLSVITEEGRQYLEYTDWVRSLEPPGVFG